MEIYRAVEALSAGKLVAFPTETVYGLGADAENANAVASIFSLKGRPSNHPLIVHVAKGADLSYWAKDIPIEAKMLVDAFWPGPLTLILKRSSKIPSAVAGGQDTIGLRCPSHPVAQELLLAFKDGKGGVAAPSANRFGHVSPTLAKHVRDEFGYDSRLAMILDGGQSEVGIESTILDLSRVDTHGPVLLRPGKISVTDIANILGKVPVKADKEAPRVSGSLQSHYAPKTPVILVPTAEIDNVLIQLHKKNKHIAIMHYSTLSNEVEMYFPTRLLMPSIAEDYSHKLYAVLRILDEKKVDLIIAESPPSDSEWDGINDRLSRAAHDSKHLLKQILI